MNRVEAHGVHAPQFSCCFCNKLIKKYIIYIDAATRLSSLSIQSCGPVDSGTIYIYIYKFAWY